MSRATERENYAETMQIPRPDPGVVIPVGSPPPYSAVVASNSNQEYGFHPGYLPSAPYPTTSIPNQAPYPMPLSIMPEHYYNGSTHMGPTVNQYPTPHSPQVRTVDNFTPKPHESGCCGDKISGWRYLRIASMLLAVLILIGGITYFLVYQIFDD